MRSIPTDIAVALHPITERYLVTEHVSSTGSTDVFINQRTHGATFYGMPPHRRVFPGCIVEVSVRIVGINKKHLPRVNPFVYRDGFADADRKYVRGVRAKAKRIAKALKNVVA